MQALKTPNAEPIPGYRLIEPLGSGGFGEVWKCVAPGGLFKAVKFVAGGNHLVDAANAGVRQELRALQHIKTIRHPFLLSIDRAEVVDGDLVIVMELADRSLHDLLTAQRAAGRAGIERGELLRYLAEAADVLDVLNQEHGLQHLDVKPRNLFLVGRHVKLADFGLVNSLSELHTGEANPAQLGAVTPVYASPESFLGRFTLYSDQYSLAVSYHELLTGELPFVAKNARQMALQHLQAEPDLHRLPMADRAIVARALAKEPRQRFPSCIEFIHALQAQETVTPLPPRPSSGNTRTNLPQGELTSTRSAHDLRGTAPAALPPAAPPTPAPAAGADSFVPGYHFLECVARLPFAEIWKAQTRDGRKRLVKFVMGVDFEEGHSADDPLARLRSLRHDTLAPLEIVRADANRLALITDPGDITLAARLKECQLEGLQGIPRAELLDYLFQAARALDDLYQAHRLQHIGLTPRQLVLNGSQLRILDFGLVELLWLPLGQQPAALNTRYAALELFDGQISRSCDQYSLALIYQELLTGVHAYRNLNQRQMASIRTRGKPDLGLLPSIDRPAVLRALHPDPEERFRTCTEFVETLADAAFPHERPVARSTRIEPVTVPGVKNFTPLLLPTGPDAVSPSLKQFVEQLAAAARNGQEVRTVGTTRFLVCTGSGSSPGTTGPFIEHNCFARLVPGTAQLKLDGFRQQFHAEPLAADDCSFTFHVKTRTSFWQRCTGRTPGLEVRIQLRPRQAREEALTPVTIQIVPINCGPQALHEIGPTLLESLRKYLQTHPDRRGHERFACDEAVQVAPLFRGQQHAEAIAAQVRNVSLGGMALCLPGRPAAPDVCIHLARPEGPIPVLARIIHAQPLDDGNHLVGVCFIRPDEL